MTASIVPITPTPAAGVPEILQGLDRLDAIKAAMPEAAADLDALESGLLSDLEAAHAQRDKRARQVALRHQLQAAA